MKPIRVGDLRVLLEAACGGGLALVFQRPAEAEVGLREKRVAGVIGEETLEGGGGGRVLGGLVLGVAEAKGGELGGVGFLVQILKLEGEHAGCGVGVKRLADPVDEIEALFLAGPAVAPDRVGLPFTVMAAVPWVASGVTVSPVMANGTVAI